MNKNLNKFKVFTLVMLLTVIMVFVNVMQVNAEGILCAKGEEVNNKIEEVVVSHTKKDYNGASDNGRSTIINMYFWQCQAQLTIKRETLEKAIISL
ncbi:MAG: hypothetical protein SPL05_05030 [Eubacteriales bacterium]|nr:hypothetical protein [Eubacteriales bacterium]